MIATDLGAIAEWCAGELRGGDAETTVRGVTIDSRRVRGGELFVALPGERVDGHQFVAAACEAGAAAALVTREQPAVLPQVLVADGRRALGAVAAGWRRRFDIPVVGVAGSNGKTTVKAMLGTILERVAPCLVTRGNHNNELGLPLTLARLGADHRYAVLELGASRPGDLQYLTGIARPDIGIITGIAAEHLDGFGDLDGVAAGEGELLQGLAEDGVALINADDAYAGFLAQLAGERRVLRFGFDPAAEIRGMLHDDGGLTIRTPRGRIEVRLQLLGRHNCANALAATAAAEALDVPLETVAAGLGAVQPAPGRLVWRDCAGGWALIDDTYNANPASLQAAIEVLAEQAGETWLVLGDMAELGGDSRTLHARAGAAAQAAGIDRLYTVGRDARAVAAAFGENARHFDTIDALREALRDTIHPGVCCLVKGSRSAAMERIVAALDSSPAEIGSRN